MVDKVQMKETIKRTLFELGDKYASDDAVSLVWCTGYVESYYRYIKQIKGPARGFFQLEPSTCVSAVENYFKYRKELRMKAAIVSDTPDSLWGSSSKGRWDSVMESNIKAGIIHCRIKYWRAPAPMPDSIEGYAKYWKKYYNTLLGKGEVRGFLKKVEKYADFI